MTAPRLRARQALVAVARTHAGRRSVAPDDVIAVARPVLGHRLAGGTDVVSAGLDATPIPVA